LPDVLEATLPGDLLCQDSVALVVRVPKSGSQSLGLALGRAFNETATFYLPNTLELDGRLSRFQHFRFRRAQIRNLLAHYGSASLQNAFALIDSRAAPGDLLSGGHIDFPTVRRNLRKRVKIITILRDPYARCRSEYFYARQNYLKKSALARFDSNAVSQIAAKYAFDGYLDFLMEHRIIYGDIAASYLGVRAVDDFRSFFHENVFHAGVLEHSEQFSRSLSDKMGRLVDFPYLNRTGSGQHVTLSAAAKRKIEKLYERDLVLYEWQLAAIPAAERVSAPAKIHVVEVTQEEGRECAHPGPEGDVLAFASMRRAKWTFSRAVAQAICTLEGFAASSREAMMGPVTWKRLIPMEGKTFVFLFVPPILRVLIRLMRDERVPVTARVAAAMALGYRISPFNLIPDSVPVLGYADDVVIIGGCIIFAWWFTPSKLIAEHLAVIGSDHG
jgi:hypothetical protein